MTRREKLIASSIAAIVVLLIVTALRGDKRSDLHCAIVHETKAGCPAGYTRESKPRFTEKDGSKEFACIAQDQWKDMCTDVLRPGESERIEFFLPGEPEQHEEIPARRKL